jgi:hypothetical protein
VQPHECEGHVGSCRDALIKFAYKKCWQVQHQQVARAQLERDEAMARPFDQAWSAPSEAQTPPSQRQPGTFATSGLRSPVFESPSSTNERGEDAATLTPPHLSIDSTATNAALTVSERTLLGELSWEKSDAYLTLLEEQTARAGWFYMDASGGHRQGPVTLSDIVDLFCQGQLNLQALVFKPGCVHECIRISECEEITAAGAARLKAVRADLHEGLRVEAEAAGLHQPQTETGSR